MKTIIRLFAILFSAFIISSCATFDINDEEQFIGTYTVNITEQVTWGYDSGTLTDTGTLYIEKSPSGNLQTKGMINTTARVIGSYLYLDNTYVSDSYGYISTSYSSALLVGNTMSFTGNAYGQLKSNGKMYPYSSYQRITATKIK